MSGGRMRRNIGRRAEEDGDFSDFYAGFYGADEGSDGRRRPQHRDASARRGAAFFRDWPTLARRSPVILAVALVAAGLLLVGVSVSATKLGTGSPALGAARTTGSPSQGPSLVAKAPTPTRGSTHPRSAPTASAPVSPPVATPGSDGRRRGGPTVPGHPSAGVPDGSAPGSSTGSTPVAPAPTPTKVRTTFTPSPNPTKICLVPDLLHPGKCLVSGP